MKEGNVTKVVIRGYRDKKVKNDMIDPPFELPINPEEFNFNLKVNHDMSQAQGTWGNDPLFKNIAPEEKTIKFMLDNTGTVEGNKMDGIEVADQVDHFLTVAYKPDPETHEPPKCKISYGEVQFDCKCTKVDVNYVLFRPDGSPLRAKVTATFVAYWESLFRTINEDKRSPDLTHVRTLVEGDTLPLMTFRIYGDNQYYLQVAKANGLTSFRNLPVGQEVIFPAIDKEIKS